MPRFAANLSFLFTEIDFLDRFAAAAAAGFRAVEFLFPYDHAASTLKSKLSAAGLEQALFNLPSGDWARGERGLAALPGREAEFRDGVARALDYARALGCKRLHAPAGIVAEGADAEACLHSYVANLTFACDQAAADGITICIEPINQRDMPGFYLRHTTQALTVMHMVRRPNLKLQYDVYHAQISEGDLATTLSAVIDHVGHVQIANPPLRHEPGEGEINYVYIFNLLDGLGYSGWVGCEYKPKGGTLDSLKWGRPFGIGAS